MNTWLTIALAAYLLGATIEGASAASQLLRSILVPPLETSPLPQPNSWRMFAAIFTVSLCGATFWPCRLLHRSFKSEAEEE